MKKGKFTKYSSIGAWICLKCKSIMPKDTKICWICNKKKTGKEEIKRKQRR